MARYNEILVGRFNRALQKLTAIKGSPPTPQLAGEIGASIPFEDLESVELRFISGWLRYGTRLQATAVAAQFAAVQIRNPPNSNVIAVVESLTAFNALTDNPTVFAGRAWTTDLTGPQPGIPIDLRQGVSQGSASLVSSGNNAAVGGGQGASVMGGSFPANGMVQFVNDANQEFPVLPGSGLAVWANTVNQNLTVCIIWRERYLEESERT